MALRPDDQRVSQFGAKLGNDDWIDCGCIESHIFFAKYLQIEKLQRLQKLPFTNNSHKCPLDYSGSSYLSLLLLSRTALSLFGPLFFLVSLVFFVSHAPLASPCLLVLEMSICQNRNTRTEKQLYLHSKC